MHQIDPMQEEQATGIFTQTENIKGSAISAAWNYLASQRVRFSNFDFVFSLILLSLDY